MSTLKYRITEEGRNHRSEHRQSRDGQRRMGPLFFPFPHPLLSRCRLGSRFFKHLGFYAYRLSFLKVFAQLKPGNLETAEKLEQLRALENGYRIKVIETLSDSIEIDTPRDIEKVESIIARQRAQST
jgi:3-deoxy-manno-octulosonate cytidylyltransferase (CMP-KDO synthetase)